MKHVVFCVPACSAGGYGDQLRHNKMADLMQRVQQQATTNMVAAEHATAAVYAGALLQDIVRTLKLHILAMNQVCLITRVIGKRLRAQQAMQHHAAHKVHLVQLTLDPFVHSYSVHCCC